MELVLTLSDAINTEPLKSEVVDLLSWSELVSHASKLYFSHDRKDWVPVEGVERDGMYVYHPKARFSCVSPEIPDAAPSP